MILSDAAFERLKTELAGMDSWKDLTGSQFVKHLAIFIGWAIEDAANKVERARHEAFIDTALNRSSILAHGEGMEYMPRKPIPAAGRVTVTNQGEYPFTLVREREFMSDAQVVFTLTDTITVPAGGSVDAPVEQRSRETLEFAIDAATPFYELLLGRDISRHVVSFRVFVAEDGENYVEWNYDRLLTNSYSDSLVFDEFYHFTDQIGIRFGNGDFGKIPAAGSKVRVDVVLTDGNVVLLEKQTLYPVDEITDDMGQIAAAQIAVSQTIQNGVNQEDTEEMRRDLHYAPVYNERLVWDNDYKYFLRRRFPEIVFAVAWGEEEAEKMWGYDINHINKIWICAYSPKRDIKDVAMQAIRDVPFMCRNFQWYEPEHIEFSLNITGKVLKDCVLSEVKSAIVNALDAAYGKTSPTRRDVVLLHEVYEAVYSTGYFEKDSGAWFEATIQGQPKADLIYQMVSIDMDATVIELSYRDG
ncbi:MAG: hypothetical protein E7022_03220 [Desulfovibrio desulfuricans]|nr:hypothetical protein [Desulfovibrio desulfuricans]